MESCGQALPSGSLVRAKGFLGRGAIAALAAFGALAATGATAQQPPAIVQPGSAVVTGYAGFAAYPPPQNADPYDYLTINTLGPSARVVDLTNPGPQGASSNAPKTFTVTAAQVGQVFGVALDNAPQPNIYLAATSAYGLSVFTPDAGGLLKRQRQGGPGVQFVPGQFGPPELGGSAGSIWRVSGSTGQVSLFATVGSGLPASLGGLAFDLASRQIFAADRSTGVVYRLSLDGAVRGTYDHGVEGRPNAGLGPVPPTPPAPISVASPIFTTDNPASWGFAQPARRVFALAVYNGRLYYSIAQGPQVWSAGISPSGAIPGRDARLEVEVPSLADGVEITSIAFDAQGRMYLAERGRTTGDYFLYQLASAGQTRAMRFVQKPAGDPTPGRWRLQPDQYSVGKAPFYNNANGGVALGYGYTQSGVLNPGACGATVWTTGDRLLDPGDPAAGAFPTVDGLQGNATSVVQPQNMPPTAAWFIDYDDQPGDANFRGYMGDIATIPCAAPTPPPSVPTPPPPPPVTCPPGTYFSNGQCLIFPVCPPGTNFQNGQCVYPQCPPGFVIMGGQCVPPPQICPPGTVFFQGQCVPLNCPPGLVRLPNGFCSCPPNTLYINGQCVPPNQCPPGAINLGGICFCPNGLLQGGQCQPFTCPAGQILTIEGCKPITCPAGQELKNGQCVPIVCGPNQQLWNNTCVPKCGPGLIPLPPNGACGLPPPPPPCMPPNEMWNGQCVPKCPPNQVHQPPNGQCGPGNIIPIPPVFCFPPNEMWNGQCVPKCPPNQVHQPPNGQCGPGNIIPLPPVICLAPNELVNGECKPPCPPNTIRLPNGLCGPGNIIPIPPVFCLAPNEMINGECKPPCPPLSTRQPDGSCKPIGIINPPVQPKPPVVIDPVFCLAPNEMINGECKPPCPPLTTRQPDGSCKPMVIINPPVVEPKPPEPKPPGVIDPVICLAPNEMVNGECKPPCPPLFTRQPDGTCKPPAIINPPVLEPKPPTPPITVPPVIITPPTNGPQIQLQKPEPPPPPPCNPPNQMIDGECKPPVLQINPGLLQILPQLQMNP